MSTLSKFNVLKSISVPNVGRIVPRGLLVVTGPNSAGKTQMLKDIQSACTGAQRKLVVCSEISIEDPTSLEDLMYALEAEGSVVAMSDTGGNQFWHQASPFLGEGTGGWSMQKSILKHHFSHMKTSETSHRQAFYSGIGATLVTSLFLKRRLQTCDESASFDYETKHPVNELQALYCNANSQQELTNEVRATFGRGIWLDASRGGKLCLRVSDSKDIPSAEDRLQPEKMKAFRTIDSEGDGLKSYVAVCISLLLGKRPICLVDEPEMCLHPPQAYALGRFIGRHGTTADHCTFVATHSSHLLRGIIEATDQIKILRLSRSAGRFVGDLIPYETLKSCIDRPSTKVETILDGIFSEAVTVVESEGDRAIYEAATETLGESLGHDVHFVSVGGIGGFASTSSLYRQLRIPTVVIADLDLLSQRDALKNVLNALTTSSRQAEITTKAQRILAKIEAKGPSISETALRQQLMQIHDGELNWANHDYDAVLKKLKDLSNALKPLSSLKHGGIDSFKSDSEIEHDLRALLNDCSREGLFLVPVGELEFWCKELMKHGPSRQRKSEWANEAAVQIRTHGRADNDVWAFVKSMADYQRDCANRLAGYQQ